MASWSETFCEINGIKMHYTRTGIGKFPLLMLHGLSANGLCWTDVAHSLESKYDVIMPDLRGHGETGKPEYGYRYDDHANDIAGLINYLGISAPILIGHSMGGLAAAVVASRFPLLVRGLVLVEPTFISIEQQREVQNSDVVDQHRKFLEKSLKEIIEDLQIRHPHRSLSIIDRIAKSRLETSISAFDILTPPNPEYNELISSLDLPILLIRGEKGIISEKLATDLKVINPKVQIVEIKNAGHGVFYDQPENVSMEMHSFINSLIARSETA